MSVQDVHGTDLGGDTAVDRRTFEKLQALNPQTVVEQFLDARANTVETRKSYASDLRVYIRWAEESGPRLRQ